ncbi:MAG: DNA polymerase III subunit delta [Phycisphaerales bacterium]|nr:DNA polymerase III subunit delta [Phycisphaerales bacterium]
MTKRTDTSTLNANVGVAVLYGKELYLLRERVRRLKEAIEEAHGGVEVFSYDGETAGVAEVLDECRSYALMTPAKIVVVDKAEVFVKGDDRRRIVERYAAAPTERTTLVLRAETWRPNTKLDKIIIKHGGVVIKCDAATQRQATTFAMMRCERRYDATLDPEAAGLLVARAGVDLGRLDSEVAKLALAAGPGGTITSELVGEMIGLSREEEAWQIQRELLCGDPQRAIGQVRQLLDLARNKDAAATQAAYHVTDLARKLSLMAAAIDQGEDARSLGRDLKLWGDSLSLVMQAAKRMGPAAAARLFDQSVETHVRVRSGLGRQAENLERLVAEICVAAG